MPKPGRNHIYDAVIRRMVAQSLEAQEQRFAQERGADTEEQLIAYLRECAARLEHTPWPREIPGGETIRKRFATWEAALEKAGLPAPAGADRVMGFSRVQEEVARQKLAYGQKKAAKREKALERLRAQAEKRQAVPQNM